MAVLAMACPAVAQERRAELPAGPGTKAELSSGVEYLTGEYGTGEKVETISIVNSARVAAGRVIFTASLPYVRIDAPGNVVSGGGLLGLPIIVDPSQPPTRTRRQGIGDLRLGATLVLPVSAVDVAVLGQVKVPTARRGSLGTGELDYAMGAEVSKTIGGITPFGSVTYTLPGQPDGYALRNSISTQVGVGARLARRVSAQVSYGYAQSLSPALSDERQISSRVTAGLGDRLSLSLYGSAGASESAPDVAAGVQLGFRLF
jgi:hypothetical protein